MPGGGGRNLDLGRAGSTGAHESDGLARQARPDRLRVAIGRAIGPSDDGDGTEFTSNAMLAWTQKAKVDWHFITPGKPMQNGICEAFNGRMRDELLNETLFRSLDHAREAVARWVADYNHRRPHSALGYATPAAFAAQVAATGDPLREIERLRTSPVAPTAQKRQTKRQAPVARG